MNSTLHPHPDRRKLNSWKEIADYLQRDVRTVVRWEQEKGLPVHRTPGMGRQAVYAFADEIDAWLKEPAPTDVRAPQPESAGVNASPKNRILPFVAILALGIIAAALWWRAGPPRPDSADAQQSPNPSTLHFVWPEGNIQFARHKIELGGVSPNAAAAADLNHDGLLDIVAVSGVESTIAVLEGRGDGTFAAPKIYGGCVSMQWTLPADLDADGFIDLVLSCHESNQVRVLWGSALRPFEEYSNLPAEEGTRGLAIGDINRDGRLDLVGGNMAGGSVSMFLNLGSRKFAGSSIPIERGIGAITLHDLDRDGKLDLLASSTAGAGLMLLKGRADGTFGPVQRLRASGSSWLHMICDVDGDGYPDIVEADVEGTIVVLNGRDTQQVIQHTQLQAPGPFWMVVADFNGDSLPDILGANTWKNTVTLLAGSRNARLAAVEPQPIGRYPVVGAAGDFNRDGLMDAVFVINHERALAVLLQKKAPQP